MVFNFEFSNAFTFMAGSNFYDLLAILNSKAVDFVKKIPVASSCKENGEQTQQLKCCF